MDGSVGGRVPVAMRLPRRAVEDVERYARENRLTKTDAFLHFLRLGLESERRGRDGGRLDEMESLLREILRKVDGDARPGIDGIGEALSREAARFPAIESAVVFGSFARGEANAESDIDIRLRLDRTMPFSLYDLARFEKAVGRATGREVDVVTADDIKNENLAHAIDEEGVIVYERQGKRSFEDPGDIRHRDADALPA